MIPPLTLQIKDWIRLRAGLVKNLIRQNYLFIGTQRKEMIG